MSLEFRGTAGDVALYQGKSCAVLLDTRAMRASCHTGQDAEHALVSAEWTPCDDDQLWADVAEAALLNAGLGPDGASAPRRGYTVPARVAAAAAKVASAPAGYLGPEARRAAALLASGGQLPLRDVLWVARFHAANPKGWQTSAPSRWAAWGGRAGADWSLGIASAWGDEPVVASGAAERFLLGDADERSAWTERDANGYASALWAAAPQGGWLAWSDGRWFAVEGGPGKGMIELDDATSMLLAASLLDAPDTPVHLRSADPEEWDASERNASLVDWRMIRRTLTAAGEDGYTPEERSDNAAKQARDANGRFAEVGDRGVMKGGLRGEVVGFDFPNGTVIIRGDDGNAYAIPSGDFEISPDPPPDLTQPADPAAPEVPKVPIRPLDLSGILGQPRATATTPKAWASKLLQPMGPAQIGQILTSFEAFANAERQARAADFKGGTGFRERVPNSKATKAKLKRIRRDRDRHTAAAKKLIDWLNGGAKGQPPFTFPHGRDAAKPKPPAKPPIGTKPPMDPGDWQINGPRRNAPRRPVRASGEEEEPEGAEGVPPAMEDEGLTPETSDVMPLHLAIVDREDPRAVLELVTLVPATDTDPTPAAFKRVGGEWVPDAKVLADLKSATPPPVVYLTEEDYDGVLEQVDTQPEDAPDDAPPDLTGEDPAAAVPPAAPPVTPPGAPQPEGRPPTAKPEPAAEQNPAPVTPQLTAAGQALYVKDNRVLGLVSAGGADRNRGGAEELRRYWTTGKGGLKIMWNTPGDWRRCVRNLSKYLGAGAKGYCALRHHEMTGMWPGDRRNRQGFTLAPGGEEHWSTDSLRREAAVIRASAFEAAAADAEAKIRGVGYVPPPIDAESVAAGTTGRAFKIPFVVPEGISSGDKRHFLKGSLGIRTLPLPLLWQERTADGHDNSVIIGRIDHVERIPGGLGNAYGVLDNGVYGREAQRLMENGMLRFISVDLDKFEVDEEGTERDPDGKMKIKKGRMMAATAVAKPAFQECTIELLPLPEEESVIVVTATPSAIAASAGIAEAIPVEPPSLWFDRPLLNGPTPLRITDQGQVYGHIATWTTSHIGLANSTRPPRSHSGYAYFHTGVVRTSDGQDVRVGQLTLAGGHAGLHLDAASAVKHYDDTASAVADVHAGEDAYGIWVAGALRPGTTASQIRTLRASAPSGDWRSVNGGPLEMVAVCQVNVPGFPVPQALAASGAAMTSLVAAGTAELVHIRAEEIQGEHAVAAAAAMARVTDLLDPDGYVSEFKAFSPDKRKKLADEGKATKKGSFPIENAGDLRRAIQAYGRAPESERAQVRRHIVKRARALGKADLIPSDWKEATMMDASLDRRERYEEALSAGRQRKAQAAIDIVNRPALAAAAEALRARISG